jgi:hypothetical protein
LEAYSLLKEFRHFYNAERANQSLACANRPPYEAFPQLPPLPKLPDSVDPDAWLKHYHRKIFRRQVGNTGVCQLDDHDFYIGLAYAKERVGFLLDAEQRIFHVLHKGQVIKQVEIPNLGGQTLIFSDYLKRMLLQARQYMQA